MIKVEISDVKQFTCFFDAVSNTESCGLLFEPNGLSVNVLNKAHTCFYALKIDYSYFIEYDVQEPVLVIVDSKDFFNALHSVKKDESLVLIITDEIVTFQFNRTGVNTRKVSMGVLDDDYESPKPPAIDFPNTATIDLDILKDVLVDADKLIRTGTLTLGIQDKYLKLSSNSGDYLFDYENTIQDSFVEKDINVESVFNIDYLEELLKFKKINNMIELGMGNDMPLTWKIVSDDKLVECSGLIAPRIENE